MTGFSGELSQQWYVQNHGNGLYSIRSNGSRSYYLDIDGAVDANERNVQIYANSGQRFRIRWEFNSSYTSITPSFTNTRVLDVYGGPDASQYDTNVQLYAYNCGGNQLWEFEELNDVVCTYLNNLCDYAYDYAMQWGYTKEILIFNYIRSGNLNYCSNAWSVLAGNINTDFINYVNQNDNRLNFLRNPALYLDDPCYSGGIDFVHFAATMNALFYSGRDEGGWAGDLQSLVGQVKENTGNTDNYTLFYNESKRLLGHLEGISPFSMPDVLADLDGKYLYNHYNYNISFGDQLLSYYSAQASNRFINFYSGYSWASLRNHVKLYTNDKMSGIRQPYYLANNIRTVTENQALAAADAFTDFIFENR